MSGSADATFTIRTPTSFDFGLDDVGLEVSGGAPVGVKLSGGEPIGLQTNSTITVAKPVQADVNGNLSLDVKPVEIKPLVFDLRLSLDRIVPTYIRLPYRHHVGFSLFGFELVGLTIEGEQQITVQDTPPPPP
jgi:hypothetical protein